MAPESLQVQRFRGHSVAGSAILLKIRR